jgi:hypothetical protein
LGVAGLTLPDNKDFPAHRFQLFGIALIAFNISPAFILPEFSPRCGHNSAVSAAVHMPETAVNKNNGLY